MATFGYGIAGGSGLRICYFDAVSYSVWSRGTSFSPSYSGELDEIWAYIRMPYGEGRKYDLYLGIYEENGWGPNSHKFIEIEREKNLTTSGWHNVYNFYESVTAGKNYILVAFAQALYGPLFPVSINLAYDTVGANNYYDVFGLVGKKVDPWNQAPTGTGRNYSIYATYTPALAKGAMQTGKYWGEPI